MKRILILLLSVVFVLQLSAQEEKKEDKRPVRSPFASEFLIDNQTNVIPTKGTLGYVIQHRFGTIKNGSKDLWGIYAPGANIRMGLYYTPVEKLMVGWGITKKNMYNDFWAKYNLLHQTRDGSMPVAVTLYGVMAVDGRNKSVFGQDYKFTNRMSYFGQVIITRKFTDWLSLQAGASLTHYNSVDSIYDHDRAGFHFNGRINFTPQTSFIFQWDQPLKIKSLSEQLEFVNFPKANLAFGVEFSTSTHAFQLFMSSADGILQQETMMWNQKDFSNGEWMIGFTITRLWSF